MACICGQDIRGVFLYFWTPALAEAFINLSLSFRLFAMQDLGIDSPFISDFLREVRCHKGNKSDKTDLVWSRIPKIIENNKLAISQK